MSSPHIAEFEGRDARTIANAGAAVLEGPYYAAVVRRALSHKQREALLRLEQQRPGNKLNYVRSHLPPFSLLTGVVRSHLGAHPLAAYLSLNGDGLTGYGLTTQGSLELHYDNGVGSVSDTEAPKTSVLGPLMMSARLDRTPFPRLFGVYRGTEQNLRWLNNELHIVHDALEPSQVVNIEQNSGDIIFFGNEPWATQHMVTEESDTDGQTRSLVAGYAIDIFGTATK